MMTLLDQLNEFVRHVRTEAGVETYHEPIGAPIVRHGQTPSAFQHPETSAAMSKTEIGDTFEAMFAEKGAQLLEKKYGGKYRAISTTGAFGSRQTPLDFQLDSSHGGELKTLNREAANLKAAIKKAEVERKRNAVREAGLQPLLVVQVVDMPHGRVEVYTYPEFASKTVTRMELLGSYSFNADDFKRAQESSGHWAKRKKRAKGGGVRAAA